MNILIAINDKYFRPAKTMLTSLCENNRESHNVYLIYSELNENYIENLKNYLDKKYDSKLVPIQIKKDRFEGFPLSMHFTTEVYFRFLTQDILPKEMERILWLDVDMIVKENITDFYNQDFEEKCIVVCNTRTESPTETMERLNLPKSVGYFNSGLILFNLSKIRALNITAEVYFDYVEKNKDKIVWPDQDVLNVVYAEKKKTCDFNIYNKQIFSSDKLSKSELKEIDEKTAIIHYIGPIKPWQMKYLNPCYKYYRKYARMYESFKDRFVFEVPFFVIHSLHALGSKVKRLVK